MEGDYVFAMKEKVRDIWNRKRLRCWTVNPSESPACNFLRNHTKHFRPFEWTQKLSAPRSIPFLISPPTIPTRLSVTNGIVSRADRDPAVGMVGSSRSHQPTCLGLARSRKESKLTFFFFFLLGKRIVLSYLSEESTDHDVARVAPPSRFVVRISGSFWNEYITI